VLDGHDPDAEELERRFKEQQRSEQLQREMENLRQQAGAKVS
jgi:hypothetical protein